MRRAAAVLLSLLGLFAVGAPAASAAPSAPSLYEIPLFSQANQYGTVSFGWGRPNFNGGILGSYRLTAHPLGGGPDLQSPTLSDDPGSPIADYSANLPLVNGQSYLISVDATAFYSVPGLAFPVPFSTTSAPVFTIADFTGPGQPTIVINGGGFYTNRLTVDVRLNGDIGESIGTGQLDFPGNAFECKNSFDLSCPFPLAYDKASNVYSGSKTIDLSGGDGLKTIWARLRDQARYPTTSSQPIFGGLGPINGNPGATLTQGIYVDTTPPVAAIKSATPSGVAGKPVTLDASGSTDALSGIRPDAYKWQFGDGTPDVVGGSIVSHLYPGPGVYDGRVIVYDKAGHSGAPLDTNFSSVTFKTTVTPAPVVEEPGTTPSPTTPAPTTPEATTPDVAGASPGGGTSGTAGPKPDITLIPLPPKPDVKLSQTLPTPQGKTAHSTVGPLATARILGTVKTGKPIPVKLNLRKRTKVRLKVEDPAGTTVTKSTELVKAGTSTIAVKAPSKAGNYTVFATAGAAQLRLAVAVKRGGHR